MSTSSYAFHFQPRRGWMNDPNGLIERDGVHHLFFQHNPVAPTFGRIHWGHASSRDLVSWTEQPLALTPGDAGDYDRDGCWSGCAVRLPTGQVALVYSAHRDGADLPALAWAADPDLVSWTKAPGNPVISAPPPVPGLTDLRDHAVLREDGRWRQVLAAGRDSVLNGAADAGETGPSGGLLVSYLCEDDELTRWRYDGVLLDGPGADLPGEVWECPDLFEVGPGQTVGILSWYTRDRQDPAVIVNDVIWLTGDLRDGRFTPTRYGRLDLGDRFYAPQSYPTVDGRRLMFGWLKTQLDPASAGAPAVGTASLPRRLRVRQGRLVQDPAEELDALDWVRVAALDPSAPSHRLARPAAALQLHVTAADAAELAAVVVRLGGSDGHELTLSLEPFGQASSWVRDDGRWVAEQPSGRRARVLVDAGLVEVFGDDGRAVATSDLALGRVRTLALVSAGPGVTVTVSTLGDPLPDALG